MRRDPLKMTIAKAAKQAMGISAAGREPPDSVRRHQVVSKSTRAEADDALVHDGYMHEVLSELSRRTRTTACMERPI